MRCAMLDVFSSALDLDGLMQFWNEHVRDENPGPWEYASCWRGLRACQANDVLSREIKMWSQRENHPPAPAWFIGRGRLMIEPELLALIKEHQHSEIAQ